MVMDHENMMLCLGWWGGGLRLHNTPSSQTSMVHIVLHRTDLPVHAPHCRVLPVPLQNISVLPHEQLALFGRVEPAVGAGDVEADLWRARARPVKSVQGRTMHTSHTHTLFEVTRWGGWSDTMLYTRTCIIYIHI